MRKFLLHILSWTCISLQAQLHNDPFYEAPFKDSLFFLGGHSNFVDSGSQAQPLPTMRFDFQSLFFVRNNEYFTRIDPGHTWFGNQLVPSVYWYPSSVSGLALRGGLFLLHHYGETWPSDWNPVVSLSYQYKHTRFVMGTLYGGLEHRLIEPLYAFERGLYDRYEQGFQILHNSKYLEFDTWINWRQTTYPNIPEQPEVFNSGINAFVFFRNKKPSYTSFDINLQLVNHHEGGALNQTPVVNHSNAALGFRIQHKHSPSMQSFVKAYGLYALDHSPQINAPFNQGIASYLHAGFRKNNFQTMLSYWYAEGFFSPYGMPMMGSFSYENPQVTSFKRHLLFVRFMYSIAVVPQSFYTELRLEPIANFADKRWDYSFGIYFIYKHSQ